MSAGAGLPSVRVAEQDGGTEAPRRSRRHGRALHRRTRIARRAVSGGVIGLAAVGIAFVAGAFGNPDLGSKPPASRVAGGAGQSGGVSGTRASRAPTTTGAPSTSRPTAPTRPTATTVAPTTTTRATTTTLAPTTTTRATTTTLAPTTTTRATTTTSTSTTTTLPTTTTTTVALPAPSEVRVEVLNGSGVTGQAAVAAAALQSAGFTVNGTANAASFTYTETVVDYPPGSAAAAETLAAHLVGSAVLQVDEGLPAGVVDLILGASYGGVHG